MIRRDRTDTVIAAVGRRISAHGDTQIRVSSLTMRVLMNALGLGDWDEGQKAFREVDALALDMIRHLAWSRFVPLKHIANKPSLSESVSENMSDDMTIATEK